MARARKQATVRIQREQKRKRMRRQEEEEEEEGEEGGRNNRTNRTTGRDPMRDPMRDPPIVGGEGMDELDRTLSLLSGQPSPGTSPQPPQPPLSEKTILARHRGVQRDGEGKDKVVGGGIAGGGIAGGGIAGGGMGGNGN